LIFFRFSVKVKFLRKPSLIENSNGEREQNKEDWFQLCKQAAVEQDPEKLMQLTREICRLLDEREKGLKNGGRLSSPPSAG